jgi:ABC-type sugar transport system ATPase subunit
MTMGDRIAVMSDGVLQQVGTPRELYDAREHVRRRLHRLAGDELRDVRRETAHSSLGSHRLELPGRRAKSATERREQLEIGFRPEDLELRTAARRRRVSFPAQVDVVEYLGNQELLHARSEGTRSWRSSVERSKVQAATRSSSRSLREAPRLRSGDRGSLVLRVEKGRIALGALTSGGAEAAGLGRGGMS